MFAKAQAKKNGKPVNVVFSDDNSFANRNGLLYVESAQNTIYGMKCFGDYETSADEIKMKEKKEETTSQPYTKPCDNEFRQKIRKEIVSFLGFKPVYDRIYEYLDLNPRHVILITGERGVGKELVAKAIRDYGDRAKKPFIAVDCGAIPKELTVAELFGAKRGSYTGCEEDRRGKFEEADGGILFLDEIGNLSLEAQATLLRFLQDRELIRVGESKGNKVDVKIITATNQDLRSMVKDKTFREDLYDRLKGFSIDVPPLRERDIDIPVLMRFFIERENRETGKNIDSIEFKLFYFCICWDWPDNVRGLEKFIALCHTKCESGKPIHIRQGENYFSDYKWPKTVKPKLEFLKAVLPPPPIGYFMVVLNRIEKYDRDELKKMIQFKKEVSNSDVVYIEYPDIELDKIPSPRKHSLEMFNEMRKSGEIPPIPFGIGGYDDFIKKVRDGEKLTDAETKYLEWFGSPQEKEFRKRSDEDSDYEGTIGGLRRLYDRNEKSLRLELALQSYGEKKDLFSLPYKPAIAEFEKEYIKRALERNKQNKSQTAKEMGISVQALFDKIKKFNP